MELTLHRKTLRLALAVLVLAALGATGTLLFARSALPEPGPDPSSVTPPAAGFRSMATPAPGGAFRFLNQSSVWYWNASADCRSQLDGYLADLEISSADITLTDDTQGLLVGVHYPDLQAEQAGARVICSQRDLTKGDRSDLICRVAISKGEPGPALDVAATAAVAFGIKDYFRPRGQGAWDGQKGRPWAWDDFRPLIEKENGTWRSNCLSVTKR